jgi:glutamate racemase
VTSTTPVPQSQPPAPPASANAAGLPIGIFDSGVGGLSVLRHIRALLPHEHLIYFADSAFAPYGNKPEAFVTERALGIAEFLQGRGIKALVVACNTATVTSIKALRAHHPDLPIVGVEPGLKPAAALSKNGKVGVLATDRTLAGEKFLALRAHISAASGAEFLLQGCTGLADQIELGQLSSAATIALLERYIHPLLEQGIDTLVLGCTHYPFVQPAIERIIERHGARPVTLENTDAAATPADNAALARVDTGAAVALVDTGAAVALVDTGAAVALVDTGAAVARQLARLLAAAGLLRQHAVSELSPDTDQPRLEACTSANPAMLENAFSTLLGLHPHIEEITISDNSKNIA